MIRYTGVQYLYLSPICIHLAVFLITVKYLVNIFYIHNFKCDNFFQFPELAPALLRYLSLDSLELNGAHAGREFGENNADGEEQGSHTILYNFYVFIVFSLNLTISKNFGNSTKMLSFEPQTLRSLN